MAVTASTTAWTAASRVAGGNVADTEMHRTFNCGIGLVICVQADQVRAALNCLNGGAAAAPGNNTAFLIGTVAAREADAPAVVLK